MSTPGWARKTRDAIAEALAESRAGMFDRTAGHALVRLLTLSGRVPFQDGLDGLVPWEAAVVAEALTCEELRLVPPGAPGPEPGHARVLVTRTPLGRLGLHGEREAPEPGAEALACLDLPPAIAERCDEAAEEAELVERLERQPFDALLQEAEAGGVLGRLVREVADRVDHVESVYVYVGREVFARSDIGNTLLRGDRLARLAERPLEAWSADERLFVAAFHVLFAAGRSIRIEEFNGRQLTAGRVRRWLEGKDHAYRACLGLDRAPDAPSDPRELARRVGDLRLRLEKGGAAGFRRINGVTLAKRERVGPLGALTPAPEALAPPLVSFAESLSVDAERPPHDVLSELSTVAIEAKLADPGSTLVEELIERVVAAAVLSAGADYGMSSSIRDLTRLAPVDGSRASGALSLEKDDFFCVSVPHPRLADELDEETLAEVLQSVASRMRFNRWHFIAGNFEREEVPGGRHHFFPPLMPDISEWSDLRHPGHTNSSVRYTVRAPGPALWREPLRVYGNDYRGFFDIRLVNMSGPPFTRRELRVACEHCALLHVFWGEAARVVQDAGGPAPLVGGFTREYWTDRTWRRALTGAAPSPA